MTLSPPQTQNRTIQLAQQYIAQTYNRPPFVLTHGTGMTVWDADGKAYLDFAAGIAVLAFGHSDPEITQMIQERAGQLIHVSNLYYTEPQAELAALLCENSFADKVFFCNSGTEANEACLKFARKYAYVQGKLDKTEIIGFSHAFHGRTMGALSITPKPNYQDPFRPLLPQTKILPYNDIVAAEAEIGPQTCAVVVEPIQGEGGIHVADNEFLATLRQLCDKYDALLIFDEVQCGLGRTGKLWAYEHTGVGPDMMTLAKPLAAGLPIGTALITERVNQALAAGDHGSTFAGGGLVCAVAKNVLQRINTPEMLEHILQMGDYLIEKLTEINTPHIQDIRGRGLMVGIELDFPAVNVVNAGYEAGFLLVNAGSNVVRFVPPLIVQPTHIDSLINFLAGYFQGVRTS